MLLNYTSGTTGFSKGVMLTGNNLAGNVTFGIRTELLKKGDKVLFLSFRWLMLMDAPSTF